MQATLSRSPKSGRGDAADGLGKGMLNDISQINYDLLKQFQQAGKFGEWRVSQLFVGTRATAGARSTLHFDHNDNLFLQISGRKRFKLFAPTEGGNLYAYPVFHSLDRRAQVKLPLRYDAEHLKAYPRLADAEGVEVVVGPGEMLFLPAYYWHEVLTEPPSEEEDESGDILTVSINFWFEIDARRPIDVPFNPQIRLEFARQLESLTALILGDGSLVPTFFRALAKQWADAASLRHGSSGWPSLHEERPEGVDAKSWEKLFVYVSFKACLLLHQSKVREFWAELCDPARLTACGWRWRREPSLGARYDARRRDRNLQSAAAADRPMVVVKPVIPHTPGTWRLLYFDAPTRGEQIVCYSPSPRLHSTRAAPSVSASVRTAKEGGDGWRRRS